MTRRKRTRAAAYGPRLGLETLEPRETPTAAGSVDPTFASGGVFSPGYATAVQVDGKIVVADTTAGPGNNDFLVTRLNPDGSLDPTFGTAGRAVIDFSGVAGGGDDRATAVGVMTDGRVVVGGYSHSSTTAYAYSLFARLTAAGQLDPAFDADGRASVSWGGIGFGPSLYSGGMAIDALGRVAAVGSTWNVIAPDAEVIRLTADGQLDPAFGGDGRVTLFPSSITPDGETANAVAIQPDGKLVVVGTVVAGYFRHQGFSAGWAVRLNDDGLTDGGFAVRFTMTRATAVAVQADGKVVVGGEVATQTTTVPIRQGPADFGAARLNPDGTPDASFGQSGWAALDLGADDGVWAVAVQPNGQVVLAGRSSGDFPVARFDADGTPDAAFNAALGPADSARAGGSFKTAVSLQGDRILVAGGAVVGLLGTSGPGRGLAASGRPDGSAALLMPDASGHYDPTPVAALAPFGAIGTDVRTAAGDVNGDGFEDTVVVTGPGVLIRVAVVSGADNTTLLVGPFDPFGGDFTGGGFVASADLDHDGRAEFVATPDRGGGGRVVVFSAAPGGAVTMRASFFGIDDAAFRGGCRAALGDVNADGTPDLAVAAGFLGGPRTALFDGRGLFGTPARLVNDFFAFPEDAATLRNGVFVAAGDVDGDGFADLVFGGGPGGAPRVFILSGARVSGGDVAGAQAAPVANFFVAGNSTDRGGVRVAATFADGDGKVDVATGSGEGPPARIRVYLGKDVTPAAEPATFQDVDVLGGTALPGGVFVG